MSDNGETSGNKGLQALVRLITNIFESERKSNYLLRANNLQKGISNIFIPYIQPPLTVFFTFFLLLISIVMYKRKMIGVFQGVFLLSNLFEVLPSLLQTPMIFVFYFVADPNAPMPFPWCAIYYYLMGPLKVMGHMIASYLNLLLGINRMVAVFTPFKLHLWFSRKRTMIYCLVIICGCIIFNAAREIAEPGLLIKTWVDDLWKTNKMEFYNVCALDRIFNPFTKKYEFPLIGLVLLLIPSFSLVVMSILLVKKLRRIRLQNEQLNEAKNQNLGANRRINVMNRIAVWVFLTFIATEVPLFALKIHGLYKNIHHLLYGINVSSGSDFYSDELFDLIYECLIPVNLIIFFLISKRLGKEMTKCLTNAFTKKKRK